MSLLDAADRLSSVDRSQVVLDPERCLHSMDRSSDCAACLDICPVGAIQPGKPPTLDARNCENCMACLPVCPTGAFQADDSVTHLLNCVTRVEFKTIELVCSMHPEPKTGSGGSGAIRVKGCLAGLGSGAYLMLAALRTDKLIVRTDACASCPWSSLHNQVIRQVSQARMLLGMWGKEEDLVCSFEVDQPVERALLEATNPPLSRRDLFRMVAQQGQVTMARMMENHANAAGRTTGKDRRRLLAAVEHFPALHSTQRLLMKSFGFANIAVSDDCTACAACSNACPTKAIHFGHIEDGTGFELTFDPKDCVSCGICERVCLPSAIQLDLAPDFEDVFTPSEPVQIHSGKLIRCRQCKSLVAAREGSDLCAYCEERKKNPFGSILPPGLKDRQLPVKGEKPS